MDGMPYYLFIITKTIILSSDSAMLRPVLYARKFLENPIDKSVEGMYYCVMHLIQRHKRWSQKE